jgi:hypothetical protein
MLVPILLFSGALALAHALIYFARDVLTARDVHVLTVQDVLLLLISLETLSMLEPRSLFFIALTHLYILSSVISYLIRATVLTTAHVVLSTDGFVYEDR